MAPPKKWEPPPSHLRKVECRCCGVKIFERNYSVHLKNKHKHEDPSDLTERKSRKITAFLGANRKHSRDGTTVFSCMSFQLLTSLSVPSLK